MLTLKSNNISLLYLPAALVNKAMCSFIIKENFIEGTIREKSVGRPSQNDLCICLPSNQGQSHHGL